MSDDAEEVAYGLIMPFVVCESQGGPYQDESFVAGYELGNLSAQLEAHPPFIRLPLRTASMRQVDLIAMRHGYTLRQHVMPVPEWTDCEFFRNAP
jgi:hypothetical protein